MNYIIAFYTDILLNEFLLIFIMNYFIGLCSYNLVFIIIGLYVRRENLFPTGS